jgi:hypothetical protein
LSQIILNAEFSGSRVTNSRPLIFDVGFRSILAAGLRNADKSGSREDLAGIDKPAESEHVLALRESPPTGHRLGLDRDDPRKRQWINGGESMEVIICPIIWADQSKKAVGA